MKKIVFSIISGLLAAAVIMSLTACSIDIHTGINGRGKNVHIDLGEMVESIVEEIDFEDLFENISENIDFEGVMENITEKAEPYLENISEIITEHSDELSGIMAGLFSNLGDSGSGSYSDYDFDDFDFDFFEDFEFDGDDFYFEEAYPEDLTDGDFSDGGNITAFPYEGINSITGSDDGTGTDSIDLSIGEDITIEDILNMDTEELLGYVKEILEANGMGAYYNVIKTQIEQNPEVVEQLIEEYKEYLGTYLGE